jgi:hypothetical protein
MRPAGAEQVQIAKTPDPPRCNGSNPVHGRKEGPLAVVTSILGVVLVVVFIVALGSFSVRRRLRDTPPANHRDERGPPTLKRWWFD